MYLVSYNNRMKKECYDHMISGGIHYTLMRFGTDYIFYFFIFLREICFFFVSYIPHPKLIYFAWPNTIEVALILGFQLQNIKNCISAWGFCLLAIWEIRTMLTSFVYYRFLLQVNKIICLEDARGSDSPLNVRKILIEILRDS